MFKKILIALAALVVVIAVGSPERVPHFESAGEPGQRGRVARAHALTPAVTAIFERSCYDCHSNRTVWPWYSKVAPVAWLLSNDVTEGAPRLNFSNWAAVQPEAGVPQAPGDLRTRENRTRCRCGITGRCTRRPSCRRSRQEARSAPGPGRERRRSARSRIGVAGKSSSTASCGVVERQVDLTRLARVDLDGLGLSPASCVQPHRGARGRRTGLPVIPARRIEHGGRIDRRAGQVRESHGHVLGRGALRRKRHHAALHEVRRIEQEDDDLVLGVHRSRCRCNSA